jgi:hypothetical protein
MGLILRPIRTLPIPLDDLARQRLLALGLLLQAQRLVPLAVLRVDGIVHADLVQIFCLLRPAVDHLVLLHAPHKAAQGHVAAHLPEQRRPGHADKVSQFIHVDLARIAQYARVGVEVAPVSEHLDQGEPERAQRRQPAPEQVVVPPPRLDDLVVGFPVVGLEGRR